jgi:hypothetical protein
MSDSEPAHVLRDGDDVFDETIRTIRELRARMETLRHRPKPEPVPMAPTCRHSEYMFIHESPVSDCDRCSESTACSQRMCLDCDTTF